MESPGPSQHRRRHAKRDHIRKRIQFAAKVAAGSRQACHVAVQAIKQNGKSDGNRRVV